MLQRFLIRWFVNAVAIYAAVKLVPGIEAGLDLQTLALVALIFGLVNALIRPIVTMLTCPLLILTLGLFTLVINAVMLMMTDWVARQLGLAFHVGGFGPAFWGALVISIVSILLSMVIGEESRR
jgi:putative membrane protein